MSNDSDLAKQLDEAIARNEQDQYCPEDGERNHSGSDYRPQQIEKKKNYPSRIYLPLMVIAFIAYILLSSPTGIGLTKLGKPNGLINVLKEAAQGQSFWQDQEKAIAKKITSLNNQPAEDAKFEKEMAVYEQESRRDDEIFYRQYPDMRPSPTEKEAEALRERADAIEEKQLKKEMEQDRLDKLSELKHMLNITREKASGLPR